ncbi:MAG: glucose 1-dehydrogenase [Rhodobacteraceae bacterium]|nr:glucose 1-dehydrogenase [Paracoccaceae bacterium]
MRLQGKIAIVTGAASGFGMGIAKKFAAEGARVLVADINAGGAKNVARLTGQTARTVNIADRDSVAAMIECAEDGLGPVDILVNNAGVTHLPMPMEKVNDAEFDRVLAVNAKSVYLTAQILVPRMRARSAGVILNVASTAALSPRPHLTWYNASKGWMVTATKSMAAELAPAGIRVNALCPVAGETPLLKSFMGADTPEVRARFLSTIPIGRFSTPEDVGNAACYLCSDEAGMITGVALEVDGGRCI